MCIDKYNLKSVFLIVTYNRAFDGFGSILSFVVY